MKTNDEIDEAIKRVLASETTNFNELVSIAGLDPKADFRFANLTNIDFSDATLAGFDFTGALLEGASFSGAKIKGATFRIARGLARLLREADDAAEFFERRIHVYHFARKNFQKAAATRKASDHRKTNMAAAHPFRVGRSRAGLGMFATESIKKGQFIAEYTGPLMTNKQCDETPENLYWFEVNARWTINGVTRKNIARYINHSCRPNADPMIRDRRVKIRAIKNIKPGDEITYDYGKDYFDAYIKPHGCRCDKCREKRSKERAEVRAANARKRKRGARKLAQAEGLQSPR